VAHVRTDVSEEHIASIIRVKRNSEAVLLVTANISSWLILFILMMEAIRSTKMLVLAGATWRRIPEDGILQMQFCFATQCASSSILVFGV
jgi:hypothetical protein